MRFLRLLPVTAALVMTACSGDMKTDENAQQQRLQQIGKGEALFQKNCTECHAPSGRGDYLKRIPATLLTRRSPYELAKWIKGSERHREMPNFDNFTDVEREALASFLLSKIGR